MILDGRRFGPVAGRVREQLAIAGADPGRQLPVVFRTLPERADAQARDLRPRFPEPIPLGLRSRRRFLEDDVARSIERFDPLFAGQPNLSLTQRGLYIAAGLGLAAAGAQPRPNPLLNVVALAGGAY